MAKDMGGAVVLGVVGSAVGIFAVNYWVSDPGESWIEQISDKLSSKTPEDASSSTAPALPGAKRAAATRQLGAKPVIPPPGYQQPRGQPRGGRSTTPTMPQMSQALSYIPATITPDMVREVASRLNAMMHLNLPTTGVITTEMTRAIKQLQQQFGLATTGLPDARLLQQLQSAGAQVLPVAKRAISQTVKAAPLATEAQNFISKLFGGPPSTHSTGPDEGVRKTQNMLNAYFKDHPDASVHVLNPDGIMGSQTAHALTVFQAARGLPQSGAVDGKTHDALDDEGPSWFQSLFHTGADAGIGDWKSETQLLGGAGQDVISRAMAEGDLRTLRGLGRALKAANFPQAAAACDAASRSGASHTGYYGYVGEELPQDWSGLGRGCPVGFYWAPLEGMCRPIPPPAPGHFTGAEYVGGGMSFDEAWSHANQKVVIGPDGKPVNTPDPIEKIRAELSHAGGAIVSACAPEDMSVVIKAAIQGGHAVGVTVTTSPPNPTVAACIDGRVRRLIFSVSGYMDAVTATF